METMDHLDVLYEKTDELDLKHELELKQKKYQRGDGVKLQGLKDKKLRGRLAAREDLIGQSANVAAKSEKWLNSVNTGYLEAEGIEKTWNYKNQDIVHSVDMLSSKKAFDLVLPELGPYTVDYTANGRYMAMAGRKGHLAIIDTQTLKQIKEFQVRETVRDVAFFHNELYFAAAQKKYTYIYNNHGIEGTRGSSEASIYEKSFPLGNDKPIWTTSLPRCHYWVYGVELPNTSWPVSCNAGESIQRCCGFGSLVW